MDSLDQWFEKSGKSFFQSEDAGDDDMLPMEEPDDMEFEDMDEDKNDDLHILEEADLTNETSGETLSEHEKFLCLEDRSKLLSDIEALQKEEGCS